MNTAQRSIYFDKLIFYFSWNLFNKHSHLNSCSFVNFHLYILSHFEFIEKFFEIVVHCSSLGWILWEKFIDVSLLLCFFLLKVLFILLFISFIFFIEWSSYSLFWVEMAACWLLSLMNDSIRKDRYSFEKTTILMLILSLKSKEFIKKLIVDLNAIIFKKFDIIFHIILKCNCFIDIISQNSSKFLDFLKFFMKFGLN